MSPQRPESLAMPVWKDENDGTNRCPGIAVHVVNFDHHAGPAFYASLPADDASTQARRANGATGRIRLVACLLDHAVTMGSPIWKFRHSPAGAAFPIRLARDRLGRPLLRLGDYRGPAISFSTGGGSIWGALCGDESDIGIDLAASGEFQAGYPLHRVFHDHELDHALRLTDGDWGEAAALLWSVKEAVVKSLGCAFHLVAPRHVHVYPWAAMGGRVDCSVRLAKAAMGRLPTGADRPMRVRSFSRAKRWFSIALLSRQGS